MHGDSGIPTRRDQLLVILIDSSGGLLFDKQDIERQCFRPGQGEYILDIAIGGTRPRPAPQLTGHALLCFLVDVNHYHVLVDKLVTAKHQYPVIKAGQFHA